MVSVPKNAGVAEILGGGYWDSLPEDQKREFCYEIQEWVVKKTSPMLEERGCTVAEITRFWAFFAKTVTEVSAIAANIAEPRTKGTPS